MYYMQTYPCPYCMPRCRCGRPFNDDYRGMNLMMNSMEMNSMDETNMDMNFPMNSMNVNEMNNPRNSSSMNPMNVKSETNTPANPSNRTIRQLEDHGNEPFVIDIEDAAERNNNYRTAIWTGEHLQVTLMSLRVGEDIGLEVHPDVDQFLRIEDGNGFVQMGDSRNNLDFERRVSEDDAIMVPAGVWHNLTNTGNEPLKLYTIYAPPEHPFGTVHRTKADAMADEEN